jgi:hypothetical protein
MDLLSIARKMWRYKLLTLPVILLTFCGAVYAAAFTDPVYEAHASYLLINPPAPPTPEKIARDPSLRGTDNPYTRFADQSVVVEVLTSALSSESARRELEDAGADTRYTVAPKAAFGYSSSPIVEITGVGLSPNTAIRTAEVVGDALRRELKRMQNDQGIDAQYAITTEQVEAPTDAELRASGQARMLVAVLAVGALLLFVVISVADAVTGLLIERRERAAWAGTAGDGETWWTGPWPPDPEAGVDSELVSGANGDPAHAGEPLELFPYRDPEAGDFGQGLGQGRGARQLPDDYR